MALRRRPVVVGMVALVAHLAVGVVPYLGSGLVAPTYGVAILWSMWLVLLLLGAWWWHRRPMQALAMPGVALVAWVLIVTLRDWLLGWTA